MGCEEREEFIQLLWLIPEAGVKNCQTQEIIRSFCFGFVFLNISILGSASFLRSCFQCACMCAWPLGGLEIFLFNNDSLDFHLIPRGGTCHIYHLFFQTCQCCKSDLNM